VNIKPRTPGSKLQVHLGPYEQRIDDALAGVRETKVMQRLRARDYTLWKPEPKDIINRLGWLDFAEEMECPLGKMRGFADIVRRAGYTHALLLGMGGSSLAPEVFRKTFGVREGYLDLAVLDTTDPGAIGSLSDLLDPGRTLFIVATKSGDTVETLSLFKFFFSRLINKHGFPEAGKHFIAITDPESPLEKLAGRCRFRATFFNDPMIGGRYSALSFFGLVPAALIGLDLSRLLERAEALLKNEENEDGARLGVIMGELAKTGRDKLTLIAPPAVAAFGDWLEQLVAESTGKEGKGVLPVVGEPLGPPEVYGPDRLFVSLSLAGDPVPESRLDALEKAGHPVLRLRLDDLYDLGEQILLWEMATAVAGHCLGINPFDQPDVESAKVLARKMLDEYREKGCLPAETPAVTGGDMAVYGGLAASTPEDALLRFLGQASPGDYIALQAYLTPEEATDELLSLFRSALRDRFRLATTVGYGPRFLHSTGQLHKGDGGRGLFIQLTADDEKDIAIPDDNFLASPVTFGILKSAQAMGDRRAIEAAGRRVIRFHLGADIAGGLRRLIKTVRQETA